MALQKASGAVGSLSRCLARALTAAAAARPVPAASSIAARGSCTVPAGVTLADVKAVMTSTIKPFAGAFRPMVSRSGQQGSRCMAEMRPTGGSSAASRRMSADRAAGASHRAASEPRRLFSSWNTRGGSNFSLWRGHGGDPEQAVYPLIAANAAVYLLWQTNLVSRTFMTNNFTLTTSDVREGRLINLITCVFSHTDLMHLVFNMFGLYSFGTAIAHLLGPRRMLNLYLIGGLVGSASHVGLNWNPRASSLYRSWEPHLLGASGAVYTLLSLYVCMFPNNSILIFGIVPIPGWMFGLLYMGYDLSNLRNSNSTGISHASHIGGAVTGLVFYLMLRRGRLPF